MDLRKKKVVATLVFPIKEGKVLFARKTRKIGVGLWNGWGGAQEEDTIRQTALREFTEESGLSAKLEDLEYVGKVIFHNEKEDGRKFDVEVHMFLIRKWTGEPKPSKAEMQDPTFWPISGLPFHEMMPSDPDWLPLVLAGEWISGDTWQKWVKESGKEMVHCVLTKPSKIKKVDKLGDID
jgi:ADP-ribose pyrophosphatase YjhB (NUDIX family)